MVHLFTVAVLYIYYTLYTINIGHSMLSGLSSCMQVMLLCGCHLCKQKNLLPWVPVNRTKPAVNNNHVTCAYIAELATRQQLYA